MKSGAFYLSETPDVESIGWESKLLRAATWARLKEISLGMEVLVVNTHFPHERHDPTRTECVRVILQQLEHINRDNLPVVVMGDFNCHASLQTKAYATFLENRYEDTYHNIDPTSITNTFHHFRGADCPWNLGRIDWILTKIPEANPKSAARICHAGPAQVIRDAKEPLYPSDHYPIVADLMLTK